MEKNSTYVIALLIVSILLVSVTGIGKGCSHSLAVQKAYIAAGYEQVQNVGSCGLHWAKAK